MSFARSWTASVLLQAPPIAPVRRFVYPVAVPGEEEALARGAIWVETRPRAGGSYLVECALGFKEATLPTGLWGCPHPDWMCLVAGGYAYLADTTAPSQCAFLDVRPVCAVHEAESAGLLLFIGFHSVLAWGQEGVRWRTGRVSWEGITVTSIDDRRLLGLGWDLHTDRELEFAVDLASGAVTGGPFDERKILGRAAN